MVKRRHNTISDSEIVTLADRKRQEKVRAKHRLLISRAAVSLIIRTGGAERPFTSPGWH